MTTVGDQLFQYGGQPVGGGLLSYHSGRTRWLDPVNGNDGNSGKKPDKAWATMQKAADSLGYYQANGDLTGHDVVIRMPGVEEVDAPIRFDGNGVATNPGAGISTVASTYGLRTFGDVLLAHTRASTTAKTDYGVSLSTVIIVRRQINFYGLSFAGRGTGARADGMGSCLSYLVDGTVATGNYLGHHQGGNFHTVKGCNFRDDGSNDTTGIYEFGAGAAEIANCTFGYNSAARGPTGIMIRGSLTNNPFDIDITNCLFRQCPVGIVLGAGTYQNLSIRDCVFQANSVGIRGDSGCAGSGIITGCAFDVADGASAHDNGVGTPGEDTEAQWNADIDFLFTEDTYYLGA